MVISPRLSQRVVVFGAIVVVLSGCADATRSLPPAPAGSTASPTPPARQSPQPRTALPLQAGASCPSGARLRPGEGIAIDYVDFVMIGGTMFVANPGPQPSVLQPSQLGPLVAHVRCSLSGPPTDRSEPPLVDGTGAFLPVGTEVRSVTGLPPACRLAAVVGTTVRLYVAQSPASTRLSPIACPAGVPTTDLR